MCCLLWLFCCYLNLFWLLVLLTDILNICLSLHIAWYERFVSTSQNMSGIGSSGYIYYNYNQIHSNRIALLLCIFLLFYILIGDCEVVHQSIFHSCNYIYNYVLFIFPFICYFLGTRSAELVPQPSNSHNSTRSILLKQAQVRTFKISLAFVIGMYICCY